MSRTRPTPSLLRVGVARPIRSTSLEAALPWGLLVLIGALSVVAGVILLFEPSNSLATLAVIFGILLLFDGIIEFVWSFTGAAENRMLAAIVGLLDIIIGIILIRHPFSAVAAIGLVIGLWLVAAGAIRLVRAFVLPGHRLFRLLIAGVELVAGIVIVSDPHIGYGALAVIAGICLIAGGIGQIALGLSLRGLGAVTQSG
jgi:uncharacterized membrane protein HdeD (DUF308 family)